MRRAAVVNRTPMVGLRERSRLRQRLNNFVGALDGWRAANFAAGGKGSARLFQGDPGLG